MKRNFLIAALFVASSTSCDQIGEYPTGMKMIITLAVIFLVILPLLGLANFFRSLILGMKNK